jgi:hypothetical protein
VTTEQKTRTAKTKRNPKLLEELEAAIVDHLDPAFLEQLAHPELIKATILATTKQAARLAVLEVHKIAKERFGEKLDATLVDWSVDAAVDHHASDILASLRADSRRPLTLRLITKALALAFVTELKETREAITFDENFDRKAFTERARAVFKKHGRDLFALQAMKNAERMGKTLVASHDPEKRTFAQITNFLRAGRQNTTAVATSKVAAAVNRLVASSDLDIFTEEDVVAYVEGQRTEKIKVRGEVNPRAMLIDYPDLSVEKQAEVQENITKQILSMKERGAGLLKVHLDLTNEAFLATQTSGADLPLVEYKLTDALERQGYTKNLSRNAFDSGTVEQLRRRLQALYHHKVSIFVPSGKTMKEQERVNPTWIVQEERSNRPQKFKRDAPPGLFGLEEAKNYTTAIMQPGLWWYYASMGRQWIALPANVLALSTDEPGKEAERYAFLIANFLAIRVRASQRKHAGKRASYSVGKVLEESQIITKNQFFSLPDPKQQKRVRDYLHDIEGRNGALPILDFLSAFHVTIREEDEFFASGRGWTTRFWEALLDVDIPDLGVRRKALGS